MLRVAVCVSGGGTNLQAILDAVDCGRIHNTKIIGVLSNKENAYALVRAREHQIPAVSLQPRDFADRDEFHKALLHQMEEWNPDLIVLAGFLLILPETLIEAYQDRIINIHPSLIPSFCGDGFYGLKVHEAVLARGVKVTGATVHYVDEGVDSGRIISQKAVEVMPGDTPEILQKRVMEQAEWIILPAAIDEIASKKQKGMELH